MDSLMRGVSSITSIFAVVFAISTSSLEAEVPVSDWELEQTDHLLTQLDNYMRSRINSDRLRSQGEQRVYFLFQDSGPDIGDLFPEDPINRPPTGSDANPYFPFPNFSSRQGASYLVAMEVLYQTLNFYGVTHYLEKKGSSVDFRVIESRSGYFTELTKFDVAFALREMSRYLSALLCDNPSVENFYRAFAQIPPEEIGLRFKYDMAWALLGNYLPREPNEVFLIGKRWAALSKILNGVKTLNSPEETRELKQWINVISDVMGVITQLNRLMCFVDVTPNAKEEIKKRFVVKKLLDMQRELFERYDEFKEIVDQFSDEGLADQLAQLRQRED